jgi:hypothetical protein
LHEKRQADSINGALPMGKSASVAKESKMDARISKRREGIVGAGRVLAIAIAFASLAAEGTALADSAYLDGSTLVVNAYGGSLIYVQTENEDELWVNIDVGTYYEMVTDDHSSITQIDIYLYYGSDTLALHYLDETLLTNLTNINVFIEDEPEDHDISWGDFTDPPYTIYVGR